MFVVCDSDRLVYLPLNAACNGSSTCTLHPSGNTSGGGQAVKVCDYHHHQPGVYVCSCTVCVRAVYPSSTSTSTCIFMYTSATLPHHVCVYHSIPHSHPSTPPISPYLPPPSYIPLFHPSHIPTPPPPLPHPHPSCIPPTSHPSSSPPTSPALHPSPHPHPSPHRLVPPVSQQSRSCSPTTRR